jgi:hypothetical protein
MPKLLRFVDGGDTHGDEIDPELESKFFEFVKDFKPHIRIHGGDAWNFAALRKKATDAERTTAIAPDYEAGNDFLKRFFDGGEQRYFTRGNHDERIYDVAHNATDAALRHYASKMTTEVGVLMRRLRATMLPYHVKDGVLDVEGIRAIHGYAAGVGAARKFAQVFGTCAFHHTHSMDIAPVEHWPEPHIAYGSGCLMKPQQHFNRSQIATLRHEQGWLYGYTDGTRATYFQARYKDGRVYAAENIKAY